MRPVPPTIDGPPSAPRRRRPGETTIFRIRAAASRRNLKALIWATLAGVGVFLSYPNFDLFPLQWVTLIPLYHVVADRRPWDAFGWGLWTGLITNVGGFWWLTGMLMDFGHFSLAIAIPICVLMCAYQGLVFAAAAGLTRLITLHTTGSLLWVAPTVFTAVEFITPLIFPWYMANGQYRFYAVTQIVEVTGVSGLTFLIIFVNAALYEAQKAWRENRRDYAYRVASLAIALFATNVVYGLVRIRQVDGQSATAQSLRIGMGEANVGIFEKEAKGLQSVDERLWMLRGNVMKHHLLSQSLEKDYGVDLVVLPESSFIPVPPPYGWLRFKRSDEFAFAAAADGQIWGLRGDRWELTPRDGDEAVLAIASGGDDATMAVGARGLAMQYDAGRWNRLDTGTDKDLRGLWVGQASASLSRVDGVPWFAFAVGDAGTLLIRDADGWRSVVTGVGASLNAVDALDARSAWIVGAHGTLLQCNGNEVTPVASETQVALNDVWAGDDGEVIAVGQLGVVLHRQGGDWEKRSLGAGNLHAIAGDSDHTVVVGDGGVWIRRRGGEFEPVALDLKNRAATPLSAAIDPRGAIIVGGTRGHLWQGDTPLSIPAAGAAPSPLTPTWATVPNFAQTDLRALAAVPFTEAQAYARDSKWVGRSRTPLPKVEGALATLVTEVQSKVLPLDAVTSPTEWNVPIRGFDVPVLLGLITYDTKDPNVSPLEGPEARQTYNSAMLMDGRGRVLGRYDKNYLLVFGEYIPFGDKFPQFYEWLPEASHFYPGETVETFPFKGHSLGVLICYEDIIPRFTRRVAAKDPNVLVNVTNDAWFGHTPEPYLHLALATFRSIENRLWMVRSTNTGVSAFVDAVGRIVSETTLTDPEVLVADVPMLTTWTPYRAFGDVFAWSILALFGWSMVRATLARRATRVSGRM
ncbi:MAG: apolipoprotein N-acyltransferase [Myxococcales bacterium]|nr:apolipoprotein N-acyltransferase [Myxococcales bacterium]